MLAVVSGKGWESLMKNLGCDIVRGGQTMNPSVQELSEAITNGSADKYIILPNNKNIILAAQQVQKIMGEKLRIIPTVNPMEGLAAAMAFSGERSLEENAADMEQRRGEIQTAMITSAVRDSVVDGTMIHQGDFMGLGSACPVIADPDLASCFFRLLKNLISSDSEIVTLSCGEGFYDAKGRPLMEKARSLYPGVSFEACSGGQPLYPLYLSVE